MRFDVGHMPAFAKRLGLLAAGMGLLVAVSACTTTEGTNAMTDIGTFEREVMTSTLQGFSIIPREVKEEPTGRRGPLVLPKKGAGLVTPKEDTETAMLPEDSGKVQIDATGLTDDDIKRLRNAKVVDLRSISGRPLTDAEAQKLTARMTAARMKGGPRPLYMPPEEYFTTVKGQDLVCLAKNGDLVPLDDKACPPEVRKALSAQKK